MPATTKHEINPKHPAKHKAKEKKTQHGERKERNQDPTPRDLLKRKFPSTEEN